MYSYVRKMLVMDVKLKRWPETEMQSGDRLVLSGRAAGGSESEVGATADVLKGPVVHLAHLSHPCGALTALPRGSVGSCFFLFQWCLAGPTCGSAAVRVPFALGGSFSREITLLARGPLSRHSRVYVSMCIYQGRCWSDLHSPSTKWSNETPTEWKLKSSTFSKCPDFSPKRVIDSTHVQAFSLF